MLIFTTPEAQKAYLDVTHREDELLIPRTHNTHRYLQDVVDRVMSWPLTAHDIDGALMGRVVLVGYVGPREFAWREFALPDEAMRNGIDLHHQGVVPGMNGGFINHGTEEDPDWGCHT